MIIWGTKSLRRRAEGGEFFCPNCGKGRSYSRTRLQRYFTLYFIPIIPLNVLGESVECDFCKNEYRAEVLSYDPSENMRRFKSRMDKVLKQVLLLIAVADGGPHAKKLAAIRQVLTEVSSNTIGEEALRRDLAMQPPSLAEVLQGLVELKDALNDDGKELFIKAAILVSSADEEVSDAEYGILIQVAQGVGLSDAHLRGIVYSVIGLETNVPDRLVSKN
jgi:tellurite resistance protein